jgi:hypothetical protein
VTLLLGFLIGLATPIFLDRYRDARNKQGRVELMKAEASAFARAARESASIGFWDSTDVRHLATLLEDRYSKESDRWIAVRSPTCRAAVTTFYMGCVAYLARRELYERQIQAAANATPQELDHGDDTLRTPEEIIPTTYQPTPPTVEEIRSTYTNLADRAEELHELLEKEQPLFWRVRRFGWCA